MNNNRKWKSNLFGIALAIAATAATASAQGPALKANIPFGFSINGSTHLTAGTYTVTRKGEIWWLRGQDDSQVGAIVSYVRHRPNGDEKPLLRFACIRTDCQIQAIHPGGLESGAEVLPYKRSKSDEQEFAVINVPLEPAKNQ